MICEVCGRRMRGYAVLAKDAPGTVPRGGPGICQSCQKKRVSFTEAEQDVDGACLAVKVLLRPSTYKRFREIGEARGVEVGVLMSTLADRAVAQKPKRKPRVSLSPEQVAEAAHLRVLGRSYREIADELGTSHTTVRKSLERQREAAS